MVRERIKTPAREIVDYWFSVVDECGLSVDASEAHDRCWRCGCRAPLERCHIVPASLGGADEPSNLVLLCHRCHLEGPNVTDPDIMWDWLRAYGTTLYDTFWTLKGFKEYEFIYRRSVDQEIKDRNIEDLDRFSAILKEQLQRTGYHYGQAYLNSATLAGIIRMALKNYEGHPLGTV